MKAAEARAMARQMVDVYAEFARNGAAMPVVAGAPARPPPPPPPRLISPHFPACMVTGGRASAAMHVIAGALPDLPSCPPSITSPQAGS